VGEKKVSGNELKKRAPAVAKKNGDGEQKGKKKRQGGEKRPPNVKKGVKGPRSVAWPPGAAGEKLSCTTRSEKKKKKGRGALEGTRGEGVGSNPRFGSFVQLTGKEGRGTPSKTRNLPVKRKKTVFYRKRGKRG